MRAAIATGLIDVVKAEAAATPEREVCGLLLGAGSRIEAALPAANVADDPATGFEVDPALLIAAHRAARAGGPAVVGCYHSHPSGRAEPSARDRAAAYPGQYWLIVAGKTARLFHVDPEGGFTACAVASA